MNDKIFRKKSIDRISSPESLNDYVKVASPSVWIILGGIIILLVGICVWGIVGRLETKVNIGVMCDGTKNICYFKENDINKMKVGLKFDVEENDCEITEIYRTPIQGKELSPVMLHTLNITDDDWVYKAKFDGKVKDGEYAACIITESISPMSFIIN